MLGKRLINTGSAATPSGPCTTDTLQILGDNSCVAYYKMSDATDESGSYDGTPSNVNFNVAGKFGNAGAFNGSSSYMNTSVILSSTNYSISFWNLKGISGNNPYSLGSTDVDLRNGIIFNQYADTTNNGMWNFIPRNSSGGNVTRFQGGTSQVGVWQHIVITFNSSLNGGTTTFYQDGDLMTNVILGTNPLPNSTASSYANQLVFGRPGAYTLSGYFNGSIDQVRIFNKTLTSTEVTTLYDEVYCVPTIVPTANFNTVLYTGNDSTNARTDVGFAPDFTWIKARTDTRSHTLIDSVRGATRIIQSESTGAEWDGSLYITSLDSSGFTVKSNAAFINNSSHNYVAWNWYAPTAETNTSGTITSTIKKNVDAGFSIVKYTGNGNNSTIGHGLSTAPDLIITKGIDSVVGNTNWLVYNSISGATGRMFLNLSLGFTIGSSAYNDTEPTSSVFTIGTTGDINGNGAAYIAYCFHSVDGYSKIGSYTANNYPNVSTVRTGFKPAFVMLKTTNTTSSFYIYDNKRRDSNGYGYRLFANSSNPESASSGYNLDFTSDGFTVQGTGVLSNSGNNVIFLAIAEEVFTPITRNATNPFGDASEVSLYKFEDNATNSEDNVTASTTGITYATGYIDKAAVFNGTSSKIDISATNSTPVDFSNKTFTISAWINGTGFTTDDRAIISKYSGTNNTTSSFFFDVRDNDQKLRVSEVNGTSVLGLQSAAAIPENIWTHVVYVRTATTCEFFINGASSGGSQSRTTPINQGGTTDISIGERQANKRWIGKIDQVRIFNKSLDDGEVMALYLE